MVTLNAHEPVPQVENETHQHAFVLVGKKTVIWCAHDAISLRIT